jgi:hypothetical protein
VNLLRADEVAYALNKNPNQVYRLAHYHGWQKVQLGKHVYYWKTDVESYVERGLDV